MRGIYQYVCQNRCRAEENLRCPEHSEGNGVVLKFAANRSRQLGEVCARLRFWHAKKYAPTVASAILAFCRKFVKHLKQCFFKGCPERGDARKKTVLCPAKKRYGRAEDFRAPALLCFLLCNDPPRYCCKGSSTMPNSSRVSSMRLSLSRCPVTSCGLMFL